jgi:drug/metabolite transporter (DMT)-like permease
MGVTSGFLKYFSPVNSDTTKRYTAFALVYLIWGSTYLGIRYAIETIPPFLMAGVRFLLAGVVLYAWVRFRGTPKPEPRHWRNAGIMGILLLLCGNGGVVWAEQTVPSGITALLIAIVPLWLVVLDWIRPGGRTPSTGVMIGVVVGLAGVLELVGLDTLRGGHGDVNPLGAAVLIISSLAWSIGSLFGREAILPTPLLTTAIEMIVGGAALLLTGLFSGEAARFDIRAVSLTSVISFFYLVTFGSLVAYTAYTWLVRNVSAAAVGTYAYVNPIVAIFLGWLIAHEPITKNTVVGATIIIAAVAIITSTNTSSQAAADH